MSKKTIRFMIAAASIGALAFAAEASAQTNYLTDLGAVAPGLGINGSGQVVLQNYLYGGGTLTPLPASITAGGISSNGTVAGTYSTDPNAGVATYGNATVTEIPTTYGGLDPSVTNTGTGINAAGTVIGYWYMLNGEEGDAFEIAGGIATVLAFPNAGQQGCSSGLIAGGGGEALAINDSGQITGFAPNFGYGLGPNTGAAPCSMHAFLYDSGAYTDLGPGYGYAINANGAVTGSNYETISQNGQFSVVPLGAFLYANGTLTQLPIGANVGYGINSANYIVGDGVNGAFFYDGVVIDLNTFILASDPLHGYVTLTDARGINDSGLVVVNGVDSRTQAKHAYLLQVPLIQVSPGPLTFANQAIGTTSAAQAVTFKNTAATSLTLGTASISGSFTITSNSCAASLASAAACSISVAFAPTAAGNPSGTLTLLAGGVPIAVPLLGASPLSVSLQSSAATTTAGKPITLTWNATAGAACTAGGGSASDGWNGALTASGSKAVTETSAATHVYSIACTAGSQTGSSQVSVAVTWPAVTATLMASSATVNSGGSTTLTWSSTNATSCASTGGGSNDGWAKASQPTSGSMTITEPNPVVAGGSESLTFTITCTSSTSGLSSSTSTVVKQLGPASSSGGGGEFDLMTLIGLLGLLVAGQRFGGSRADPASGASPHTR